MTTNIFGGYRRVCERLSERIMFGVRPGLERVRAAWESLGNPLSDTFVIHVAGTNGKGSTVAFTSTILEAHGLSVGSFTSPHMHRVTERFRIESEPVSDQVFAKAVGKALAASAELTYFEVLTLAAFLILDEAAVDVAVIECGLGGTLDATNIIDGDICIITPVSHDHEDILGPGIESIASNKAGIIKKKSTVVSGPQWPVVSKIIEERSKEKNARYISATEHSSVGRISLPTTILHGRNELVMHKGFKCTVSVRDNCGAGKMREMKITLTPRWNQRVFAENICTAIIASDCTLEAMSSRSLSTKRSSSPKDSALGRVSYLDENQITAQIERLNVQGRMESLRISWTDSPKQVVFDVAHNPEAISQLLDAVAVTKGNLDIMFGCIQSKDASAMLAYMLPVAASIYFPKLCDARATDPNALREKALILRGGGTSSPPEKLIRTAKSVDDAVRCIAYGHPQGDIDFENDAMPESRSDVTKLLLITGGFSIVSEARELLYGFEMDPLVTSDPLPSARS